MIKRVYILVEGQTEETFVRDILAPPLATQTLLTPILLTTKRVKNQTSQERALPGRRFKGGVTSYQNVKRDVLILLSQDQQATAVTTMIDYYGLPSDFPGFHDRPPGNCYERARHIEEAFAQDIDRPRFHPFLTLHEFEALLFTEPEQFTAVFPDQPDITPALSSDRDAFNSPEEINEGPTTHPAARIQSHVKGFKKTLHGPLIAARIGLTTMRRDCPHFDAWVCWLESL